MLIGIVPLICVGTTVGGDETVSRVVGCGIGNMGIDGMSAVCAGREIGVDEEEDVASAETELGGAANDGSSTVGRGGNALVLEDRGAEGMRLILRDEVVDTEGIREVPTMCATLIRALTEEKVAARSTTYLEQMVL